MRGRTEPCGRQQRGGQQKEAVGYSRVNCKKFKSEGDQLEKPVSGGTKIPKLRSSKGAKSFGGKGQIKKNRKLQHIQSNKIIGYLSNSINPRGIDGYQGAL